MSILLLEPPKEAIASYDKPLEVKTDEAWYNLGVVLINSGQFEEAIASFDKVLEIEPDLYQVWYNQGIALGELGRHAEAIANWDKALEIKPNLHEAWYNRGVALLYLGRYEEAIASYDKALEIQLDLYQAWNNRGVALDDLGSHNEAIASYNKALSFKPDYHYTWNNWGNALWKVGHYNEALTNYDKALEFKADFYYAWNNRGIVLGTLGRLDEALISFGTAIKIQPDFHGAWYNRGITLKNLGRLDETLISYEKALEIQPDFYQAWNNRGSLLFNLGRLEEALTNFNNVLKIKPDFYEAWYNRGNTLGKLRRLDEAIASYDKALEFNPGFYEAWKSRGMALLKLNRFEEALRSFDKATEFKPDDHFIWYMKASWYAFQGNVKQAIENLQQAINLNPDQYREKAKTDSKFDSLREDERFQALIQEKSDEEKDVSELRHNVSWEEFENILAAMSDNRSSRVAYDRGTLEIIMPTQTHEYYKEIISFLVQELADEMGKDCEPYGSTIWRRKAKEAGAEPDNSFYIQNESLIRGRLDINLDQDPPPDLVLEIDYTNKSLDRMPIYARLGVPEIWRYDENVLRVYQLESGEYNEIDGSLAFEGFPAQEIPSFIEQNISAGRKALRQRFRSWVRQYLTQTKQVKIDYPTDLVDAAEQTWEQFEQEAKWAMAVKLFEMKRISSGIAAQLVGMDRVTFLLNLHRYGAAMIDLEEEELLSDLENA
jgi:tetratricopeptide (TPR) repeat protein/predicted HTH domain antitoxin